jgi:hypothetical protein
MIRPGKEEWAASDRSTIVSTSYAATLMKIWMKETEKCNIYVKR